MFFLDRRSALGTNTGVEDIYLWRYIPSYKYKLSSGQAHAKPGAFNIRRDEKGVPREPSASLFELLTSSECNSSNAVVVLVSLVRYKGFKNITDHDASGALKMADVVEISKDPKVFELSKTPVAPSGSLAHWDLKYEADDLTEVIQTAKSALAHICKVYVSGAEALAQCSKSLV